MPSVPKWKKKHWRHNIIIYIGKLVPSTNLAFLVSFDRFHHNKITTITAIKISATMTPAMMPMIQTKLVGVDGGSVDVVDVVDVTGGVVGITVETSPPSNARGVPTPTLTVRVCSAHRTISTANVPLLLPMTSASKMTLVGIVGSQTHLLFVM